MREPLRPSLSLIALVLALLTSPFARAQQFYALRAGIFVPKDTPGAAVVDLSSQFQSKIDQQKTGSCHIHAATALIEAFCKKVTGKEIDLSESYFLYRHLRQELDQYGMSSLSERDFLEQSVGARTDDTVERMKKGSYCTEAEFQVNEEGLVNIFKVMKSHVENATKVLKPELEKAYEKSASTCKSPAELEKSLERTRESFNKSFREMICTRIDSTVNCSIPPELRAPPGEYTGTVVKSQNADLIACVKEIGEFSTIQNPTPAQIRAELKAGNPVVCEADFIFAPGSGMDKELIQRSGAHTTVLYGYRYVAATNKTEYLVRDSNFTTPEPYTVTGCEEIQVLRKKVIKPPPKPSSHPIK